MIKDFMMFVFMRVKLLSVWLSKEMLVVLLLYFIWSIRINVVSVFI